MSATVEPLRCPLCGASAAEGSSFCEEDGTELFGSTAIAGPAAPAYDLAVATDVGYRHPRNEDAGAVVRQPVGDEPRFALVVCDGVSSSADADAASFAAVGAAQAALAAGLPNLDPEGSWTPLLTTAVRAAHAAACGVPYTPGRTRRRRGRPSSRR